MVHTCLFPVIAEVRLVLTVVAHCKGRRAWRAWKAQLHFPLVSLDVFLRLDRILEFSPSNMVNVRSILLSSKTTLRTKSSALFCILRKLFSTREEALHFSLIFSGRFSRGGEFFCSTAQKIRKWCLRDNIGCWPFRCACSLSSQR